MSQPPAAPPPSKPPSAEQAKREAARGGRIKQLMLDVEQTFMPPGLEIDKKRIAYLQAGVPNPLPRDVLRKIVELWVDKGSASILSIDLTREFTKGLVR